MALKKRAVRFAQQVAGVNPFGGDYLPGRVNLFGRDRPTAPFPHLWNYTEPLKILETFYCGAEKESGAARHNRYLYFAGLPPVLVSRDPEVIRPILAATGEKPGQFDRHTGPTSGIARATGVDSLLYANGAAWRRQKTLVAEPFYRSSLFQPEKFQGFESTFRKTLASRLDDLRSRAASSGPRRIELEPEIKVVMLEMLIANFFGGSVSYEELRDRYVPSVVHLIDYMVSDTVAPKYQALRRMLTGGSKNLKQSRADFESLTDIALSGRAQGRASWGQFKSDAPDELLRSNIRVFLAGAMEATTSFASWALSHLSRRTDIQEEVYAEVKDMDSYDPENLAQAVRLNRVLEETLRLTPALYFLPRRATEDTWVETRAGDKLLIPNDTAVMLDVWHANRCEEFWGVQVTGHPAGIFAPERWDVLASKGVTSKDILHFGFGHGPRFCPGRFLGLLEVGLVVGALVKLFRFKAVNDTTAARAGVSTKPADNVLVDIELR
jgi:cytochrome P450